MAGSTGTGKSVRSKHHHSFHHKKHPAEVKFVLIDPKMVGTFALQQRSSDTIFAKALGEDEATTPTPKVVPTLLPLCMEMDNRYELFKSQ